MKSIIRNIIDAFKDNLVIIVIFSLLLASEVYQLDYSIYSPGGLIKVDDRIENGLYESSGSFNMTYVTYRKGSLFNLLVAKIMPSYDIVKDDDIKLTNEELIDTFNRNKILIEQAVSNATYVSFKYANKEFNINEENSYIYYVDESATTDLKVGDKIIACDSNKTSSFDEITKCIHSHEVGDDVSLSIVRGNKEISVKSKIQDGNIIGVLISRIFKYDLNPNIKYSYDSSESGSSGGLMLALAMYNSLVEEDITKGMTIAGTGTIELDGSVGEISGVKYKIMGAVNNHIDLFIIPSDNYEEAKQVIEENNYDIKLLKANTFEQVLNDLKNYN